MFKTLFRKVFNRRSISVAVLLVTMTMLFAACTTGDPNDPNMGTYKAVSAMRVLDLEGNTEPIPEEKLETFSMELGTYGRGKFFVNGKEGKFNWDVNDEGVLKLTSSNESAVGTLIDGVVDISFNNIVFKMVKEGTDYVEASETSETAE